MSERGSQLLETADGQVSELIGLLSRRGDAALSLLCPGREKLGDGTVAALALHTADSYVRIAGFLQATIQMLAARPNRHRIPRLPRVGSHDLLGTPKLATTRGRTTATTRRRMSMSLACSNACRLDETPSASWLT